MFTKVSDKERAIRFYRWAAADAEREVRQGYPLLHQLPSVAALNHLQAVSAIEPQEKPLQTVVPMDLHKQLHLSQALINWAHIVARSFLGETFSETDKMLREDYLFYTGLRRSTIEYALLSSQQDEKPYKKERFSALLKNKLEPILGWPLKPGAAFVGLDLVYITPVLGLFVGTRFQFLEGRNALRYWQNIMDGPDDFPGSLDGTNILAWLGIGRTELVIPFERNERPAATALASACSHFIVAAPRIAFG